jgi:translation initiation factor IF-2
MRLFLSYCAIVGSSLVGMLFLLNYLVAPEPVAATAAKPAATKSAVAPHKPLSPMAKLERYREESVAAKNGTPLPPEEPAAQPAPVAAAAIPAAPAPAAPAAAAATPAVAAAPATAPAAAPEPTPVTTAAADLPDMVAADEPTESDAARAARHAQEKIAAERARKRKLARAREHARAEAAARQQDEYYYGQHYAQRRPAYAYAPQPSFGPFWFGQRW